MDEWVKRALAKWPDVPALYGWLRLSRRGHWLIRGERIANARIRTVINRNYAADDAGCWFFQNGPQRGYMALDYAPFILRAQADERLITHNDLTVTRIEAASLDEDGSVTLLTEHGPGLLDDHDLDWALSRLLCDGEAVSEAALLDALEKPGGRDSGLQLRVASGDPVPVQRCDSAALPDHYHFVRDPEPADGD